MSMNSLITGSCEGIRTGDAFIMDSSGQPSVMFPSAAVVEKLLSELVSSYTKIPRKSVLDVFDLSIDMLRIHPFNDGNGRTVRTIVNIEMGRVGNVPVRCPLPLGLAQNCFQKEFRMVFVERNRDNYYRIMFKMISEAVKCTLRRGSRLNAGSRLV